VPSGKSTPLIPASCTHKRGVRVVTNVERGMRWTQWPRWTSEGLLRTAKSCGPGTPTLVSSFAEVFREATVAKEPGHRGERGVTVKTNAQGMSGCFGVPVVTTLVRFFCCVRGCGCIVHPAFPAPSILSRDIVLQSSGAIRVAGRRRRVRTTRF